MLSDAERVESLEADVKILEAEVRRLKVKVNIARDQTLTAQKQRDLYKRSLEIFKDVEKLKQRWS